MSKKALSEKEWDHFVKNLLKSFANKALPERGDNQKAAKALKLSVSAIEQMKSSAKGSTKSWIKLMSYMAKLSPEEIRDFFENYPSLLKQAKPLSDLDILFEEAKQKYDHQELGALLALLISKKEIEDFVGVKIKVSKSKKKS